MSGETGKRGWLIPICIQIIPGCLGLCGIWFTVESPRWLISRGRHEEAIAVLKKIRTKEDVASGMVEAEAAAVREAVEHEQAVSNGSWLELLSGPVWRRTLVSQFLFYGLVVLTCPEVRMHHVLC